MRRYSPLGTAVVTTVFGLALVPNADAVTTAGHASLIQPGRHAAATPSSRAVSTVPVHTTPTRFALRNQTYGSKVEGAKLPTGSNTTSYEGVGCTNRAGLDKTNNVNTTRIPLGLGNLYGVYTHNYTEQVGGTVASVSEHNIAKVVLGQSALGSLELEGVNSLSRAFHDETGFHSTTSTSIAKITLTPPSGAPQVITIPTPGHPITIPGLVTIALGSSHQHTSQHGAYAAADAVDITVLPTASRVRISHTAAGIFDGVTIGTFRGTSNATQVAAADSNVRSGPNPLSIMPCQGTYGQMHKKDLAAATVAKIVDVSGARSGQTAVQTAKTASGSEMAHIAKVDIGNGALVLTAIDAQANVTRGKRITSDSKGTSVLSATSNGKTVNLLDLNGFEIPGLLEVETNVTTKSPNGIDVVAVRVTLLDGSGAVVDLGHAALQVRPVSTRR